MVEGRGGLGFAFEAFAGLAIPNEVLGEKFTAKRDLSPSDKIKSSFPTQLGPRIDADCA